MKMTTFENEVVNCPVPSASSHHIKQKLFTSDAAIFTHAGPHNCFSPGAVGVQQLVIILSHNNSFI